MALTLAVQNNSPGHYAKGTPSPLTGLRPLSKHLVSAALSLPSQGRFSSFSRLTGSLSVVEEYLALEGGPPIFTRGFTGLMLLVGYLTRCYRPITFFGPTFQSVRRSVSLSAFARRYLRNCGCFLFLWILRCFTSPRSLPAPIHSVLDTLSGGLPHSEIDGSKPGYRLPVAYRRFLRPSSPLDAETSAKCP